MKRIFSPIITALTLSVIPITVMAQSAYDLNNKALEFIDPKSIIRNDEQEMYKVLEFINPQPIIHNEEQKDGNKMYESALNIFDKLVQEYPDNFIGWYNKATAHALLEEKEKAIQAIQKSVELKPDFAEAWYSYGQILSSGNPPMQYFDKEIIQCFEKAITYPGSIYPLIDKYFNLALFNKGIAIYEYYKNDKKRYDEVINCINNAIGERLGTSHIMLSTKAFLLFEMGRYVDSVTTAESAIQLFENQESALNKIVGQGGLYNLIGLCYYKLSEPQKALDAYSEAINQLEQGKEHFEKILLAGVWNDLGILYHVAGQYEEAIGCYDKAISIDERQTCAWVNKGYTLFCRANELERNGYNIEAGEYYQKAFETPMGTSEELPREDLDYLYTNETISLIRPGYQNIRGYFFIRFEEPEGPIYDTMLFYTTAQSTINWREKIEEYKPAKLDSTILIAKGVIRIDDAEYRDQVIEEYQKGKDWALVIGINNYNRNRNDFDKLRFSRQDAEEMYHFLNTMGFEEVFCLYDEQATNENIMKKLDLLVEQTGQNDRVIIFFSGHGYNFINERKESFGFLISIDGKKDSVRSTCISMTVLNGNFRYNSFLVFP